VLFSGSLSTYSVWVTGSSTEFCGLTPTVTVLPGTAGDEPGMAALPAGLALPLVHAPSNTKREPSTAQRNRGGAVLSDRLISG